MNEGDEKFLQLLVKVVQKLLNGCIVSLAKKITSNLLNAGQSVNLVVGDSVQDVHVRCTRYDV